MSDRYVEGLKKAAEIVRRLEGPISLVAVGDAIEAEAVAAYNRRHREAVPSHRYAEGLRKEIRDLSASWTSAKDPGAAANVLLHAGRFVINNADAILASIPPDPPPMASEDEAIALDGEAFAKAVYFAETIIHHDHERHWRESKRNHGNLWKDVGDAILAELRAQLAERNLTISALSDRQMLVEALEPFAKVADDFIDASPDDMRVRTFPLRLFRRARAALAKANAHTPNSKPHQSR